MYESPVLDTSENALETWHIALRVSPDRVVSLLLNLSKDEPGLTDRLPNLKGLIIEYNLY